MKNYLLLVAGGKGSRMGNKVPKQFIELNGLPVFCYSILTFLSTIPDINIIISVHPSFKKELDENLSKHFKDLPIEIVAGGNTRFHSVKNGLKVIGDQEGIVFIHDAARPLVSRGTIERCFDEAKRSGNAVPVLKVNESLRKISFDNSYSLNRDEIRIVQTPQCFSIREVKKSFEQDYDLTFTDDATVYEKGGYKINLVDGNQENIKITFASDLIYAEFILKNLIS